MTKATTLPKVLSAFNKGLEQCWCGHPYAAHYPGGASCSSCKCWLFKSTDLVNKT